MTPAARRRLVAGGGLAAVACLLVWLGTAPLRVLRAARAAYPVVDGRISARGLGGEVAVLRDERGIPHVEAGSEADALFALGFVHAQDRLTQMLWLRRRAQGRAAAWGGPAELSGDRLARTLGIARHAARQAEALDTGTRAALGAYAAGVNARLDRIERGLAAAPPELARRGPFAPWSPADSLAIVKLYAWSLGNTLEASLVLADLIERLGGFGARPFFRGSGDRDLPLADAGSHRGARADDSPAAVPGARRAAPRAGRPGRVDPLRHALGLAGRHVGSSAWVVHGDFSASGRPLLAADAHLEATAPALFYEAHVRGGPLDVAGATLPGVPVVWSGRNQRVAWAAAHAGAVVTDLFVETLHPEDSTRVHTGSGWRNLARREEHIAVRGQPEEVLAVRETLHGPLLDGVLAQPREPLALAWTGVEAVGVRGLLEAARARDARELRRALALHHEPVLAFVYADAAGAGGVQVAGWLPRRSLPTGLVPIPGRARWYDWQGRVPFELLPHVPLSRGHRYLIASDSPLPAAGGSARIEWQARSGERAERIGELLRDAIARGPLDARMLADLQTDVHAGRALTLIEDALELAGAGAWHPEEREIAALLRGWDGSTASESRGAAAYHMFLDELASELLGGWLGPELRARYLAVPQADPADVIGEVVRAAASGEPRATALSPARVRSAVRQSLRAAWLRLSVLEGANRSKWTWGRLHRLRFRPLGPPGRARLRDWRLGPFPYPGNGATVSAGGYDPADPFEARVASVYRFAVDLAALDQVLTSLAPGQSGHTGHPHQLDGVERWLEGRPVLLLTSPLLVEEGMVSRLVLEPAS